MPATSALAASDAERIRALEAQVAEQKAMMERQQQLLESLQAEVERLKSGTAAAPAPTPSAPASAPATAPAVVVAEQPTALEGEAREAPAPLPSPAEGVQFEFFGAIQLDTIYDFDRVDPDWESTLRPSTIPTTKGEYGKNGNTTVSVKQTLMGFRSVVPTPVGQAKIWFDFDFFGTGSDAGETKFNLRHAWAEIGPLGFGQTDSNFMDISIFPNVVDWWGPSGMIFNRNPQVRYTWSLPASEFAVALEKPNGSFNTGVFGELSPEFGQAASTSTPLPDLTVHWRDEYDWGHYQVAGVLRKLEFETKGTPNNEPSFSETGWGLNLTGVINTIGRDQLKLGLAYGDGIASFFNDGGVNLAPQNNKAEAVPELGITAYYDHYWSKRWSSSIGFSINDADTRNQQSASEFDKGTYASTNLLYTPYPEALYGLELLYGKHEDVGGATGDDFRAQFTMKHKFSKDM